MDNLENRNIIISINNYFLNSNFIVELNWTKKDSLQKGNSFDNWSWINNISIEGIKPFLTDKGIEYLNKCMEKEDFLFQSWLRGLFPQNAYIKEIYSFTCAHCGISQAMLTLEEKGSRNRLFRIKKTLTLYNLVKVLILCLITFFYIETSSKVFFLTVFIVAFFAGWVKLTKWLF